MRRIPGRHLDALFIVLLAAAVGIAYACSGGAEDPYPRPDDTSQSCDRYAFTCGGRAAETPLAGGGIAPPAEATEALPSAQCAQAVPWEEAISLTGSDIVVRGPVVAVRETREERGAAALLELGDAGVSATGFTVALPESVRAETSLPVDAMYLDREICAAGTVELVDGRARMVVASADDIVVAGDASTDQ